MPELALKDRAVETLFALLAVVPCATTMVIRSPTCIALYLRRKIDQPPGARLIHTAKVAIYQKSAAVDDGDLLSHLFHELSQPLTTLNCCLETVLKSRDTGAGSRQDIRIALQQTQQVIRLISDLRALVEKRSA
jgi:signal transduction histidine kinase